jgi:23S rRNA-/tRNA-specific pseudouridylate synthase
MQSLPRKKRALEAEAEVPKTFVFICDGFRVVLPQWYVYNIFVKGRWLNPCADGSPQTYGSLLASEFSNFPASYFAAAMAAGRVHVNSALTQPNCVVRSGDLLTHRVHHHEPPSTAQLPDILFTSPRILVVSKPAGLATHAAGNILHNSLLRVLSDMELARPELFSADRPDPHLPFTPPPLADRGVYTTAALPAGTADVAPATRPLLPAHRLDRATSGVLVLTRDSVAAAALTSLFADKSDKSAGPTANANANANASAVSAAAAASANAGADESFDLSDPFYADAAATALAPADTAASSAASTAAAPVVASGRYVRKSYLARVVGRFPASAAAAGLLSCGHPALTPADAAAAAAASAAAADAAPAADGRGAWLLVRVPVQCVGIKKSFHAVPLPQRAHFPPSAAAGSAPAATDGAPAGPCALCAGFAAAGDGVWPSARDPDSACAPGPAAGATAAFPSTGVVAAEAARDAAWEPTAADWQPAREAVSAFRLVRYDPAPRAADAQVGADTDVVDAAAGSSLVECVPLTGRTHQLRVHLWWMGHPIGNDAAYGGLACAGDKVPSLAHAPWPDADMDADADENAAGAAAAAVAGADTSVPPSVEAQVSAAFARLPRRAAAFLPSDNAADVAAAPDAATTAAGAAAPADGSDFWSPLRCSRADVRAWTQDALAETRRAAEAVATDEDGFDAGLFAIR